VAVAVTVVEPPALVAVADTEIGCQIEASIHSHSGKLTTAERVGQ
jgi:hypothetical protein